MSCIEVSAYKVVREIRKEKVRESTTIPSWATKSSICEHCAFPFENEDKFITVILTDSFSLYYYHNSCVQKAIKEKE